MRDDNAPSHDGQSMFANGLTTVARGAAPVAAEPVGGQENCGLTIPTVLFEQQPPTRYEPS